MQKIILSLIFCAAIQAQIISTIISSSLSNPIGLNQDANGLLYVCDSFNNRLLRYNMSTGAATTIYTSGGPTTNPSGVTFDTSGNAIFSLETQFTGERLLFVNPTNQQIVRQCGATPQNCGSATSFPTPDDVKNDKNEFLYVSGLSANQVRRMNLTDFSVTVFAGTGGRGFSGDNGPATAATFDFVAGLALDKNRQLYICDSNNNRIRRVNTTSGNVTTVAGTGTRGRDGNGGSARNATLDTPISIAFDSFGNLYIAQQFEIRKVDTNGIITSFGGNGTKGFFGDGLDVSKALFAGVRYLYISKIGNLLVSDTDADPSGNNRIRSIGLANVNCTTNDNCKFPCFETTCDAEAKVCNFGTLSGLKEDGAKCLTQDNNVAKEGVCSAGQCINQVPVPPSASGRVMMDVPVVIGMLVLAYFF